MKKILILEANPRKDLSLNEEIRDLKNAIEGSRKQEDFRIEIGLAVRSTDLIELMLQHEPNIVHFCGHGTGKDGLVFQDKKIETDAISNLFENFKNHLECVVLNACYTKIQADEIVKHIKYVVGMNQSIRDDAAIAFSTGFYLALGYGRSVEDAFKLGKNAIQLTIDDSSKSRDAIAKEIERKLLAVGEVSETIITQEHLKPVLLKKSESESESTNGRKSNFLMLTDHETQELIKILQQVYTEEELQTICRNNKDVFGGYLYDKVQGKTADTRFSSLVDYLKRKNKVKVFLEIVSKNEPYFQSLVSDLLEK